MAINYANIFHFKAPQNIPRLEFLVCKQTIWQPCRTDVALNFMPRADPTTSYFAAKMLALTYARAFFDVDEKISAFKTH
jgi:hypothetical protein